MIIVMLARAAAAGGDTTGHGLLAQYLGQRAVKAAQRRSLYTSQAILFTNRKSRYRACALVSAGELQRCPPSPARDAPASY
jgi:hypothetical protein